jgi:hypothetical protein
MNRVVLAALALLFASRGCAAEDLTTTIEEERRLMDTTMMAESDTTSGASRTGGTGTVLMALLAFLYVFSAAGAAVDETTTIEDERRLMETTMMAESDTASGAYRSGLGTVLLALLAFLFVGNAAGAAVDETTTMADQRRLETTAGSSDGDSVSPAAPRSAFRTAPLFALASALGLAAQR